MKLRVFRKIFTSYFLLLISFEVIIFGFILFAQFVISISTMALIIFGALGLVLATIFCLALSLSDLAKLKNLTTEELTFLYELKTITSKSIESISLMLINLGYMSESGILKRPQGIYEVSNKVENYPATSIKLRKISDIETELSVCIDMPIVLFSSRIQTVLDLIAKLEI